jgi:hypothetical protein
MTVTRSPSLGDVSGRYRRETGPARQRDRGQMADVALRSVSSPGTSNLAHLADNIATLAGPVTEFAKILTGRHGEQLNTAITVV